jgi:hypothetical protein
MYTKVLSENLSGGDHKGDIILNMKIILKCFHMS